MTHTPAPLRLGFARGIAPSKWAERWRKATGAPLELVPIDVAFGRDPERGPDTSVAATVDMMIERTLPGQVPPGVSGSAGTRHGIRLYRESLGLVVPREHELAERESVTLDDLAFVRLLDHGEHAQEWPAAAQWDDPAWRPAGVADALELVAAGSGAVLMPRPLARHLTSKKQHAILSLADAANVPTTTVWATWDVTRDAADMQQLAGILRGRTARSSRNTRPESDPAQEKTARQAKPAPKKAGAKAKKPLKPGSRGAQLAAARDKRRDRR